MADDGGVIVLLRKLNGIERLSERADLVHFHENRVGYALVDAFSQELHVGDEKIIPHQLHAIAHPVRQELPSLPVPLRATVLDADDRVFADQILVKRHDFFPG